MGCSGLTEIIQLFSHNCIIVSVTAEKFDEQTFLQLNAYTLKALGFVGKEIVEIMKVITDNTDGFPDAVCILQNSLTLQQNLHPFHF